MNELKAIEIEINSHCNRACSYCPNATLERLEQGVMTRPIFERIIGQLETIQFKGRLSFSFYNEPLLCSDLDFFVEEAKRRLPSIKLVLYTNGTLLTTEKVHLLLSLGVDQFIITKHEGDDDQNYTFEKTLKEIDQSLIKNNIKFQTHLSLKKTNRAGLLKEISKKNLPFDLPCLIPIQMMTITLQGNVLPCFEDYHQTQSMGNLSSDSLEEIWNSKAYVTFRKKLALGMRKDFSMCSQCDRIEMLGVH